MKNTTVIGTLVAFLIMSGVCLAEEADDQKFLQLQKVSLTVWSDYLFTPQSALTEEPVAQLNTSFFGPYGLIFGAFVSQGLTGWGDYPGYNLAEEFDIFVKWRRLIARGRIEAELGLSYFDLVGYFGDQKNGLLDASEYDVVNPSVQFKIMKLSVRRHILTPRLYLEYPLSPRGWNGGGPNRGLILQAGIGHTWKRFFNLRRVGLNYEWSFIYDEGAYGGDHNACFLRLEAALTYPLPWGDERFSFAPLLRWSKPLMDMSADDGREEQFVYGVRITFTP